MIWLPDAFFVFLLDKRIRQFNNQVLRMKHSRKIALVANHVNVEEEDTLDVLFWLDKAPSERLSEVNRLRKNYFTWADGSFPEKIEKVIHFRKV